MKKVFVAIMLVVLVACNGESGKPNSGFVAPAAAWQQINAGALLLDVRSAGEYAQGHIEGAINIPHTELASRLGELDSNKDRPVVVYCAAGVRAEKAKQVLVNAGYQNVYNARGYSDLLSSKP
ncbi:MAG: rhodanese-like domain-containing protein [Pseudomonadota bacterium]